MNEDVHFHVWLKICCGLINIHRIKAQEAKFGHQSCSPSIQGITKKKERKEKKEEKKEVQLLATLSLRYGAIFVFYAFLNYDFDSYMFFICGFEGQKRLCWSYPWRYYNLPNAVLFFDEKPITFLAILAFWRSSVASRLACLSLENCQTERKTSLGPVALLSIRTSMRNQSFGGVFYAKIMPQWLKYTLNISRKYGDYCFRYSGNLNVIFKTFSPH